MIFTFLSKIDFPWNFMKFCENSISGPQKLFFRPWASKKAPRTLCLWRVLRRGLRGRILGAKEGFWAPKPQNGQNFMLWGQKGEACRPKGWTYAFGSVFPREYQWFWHVANHEILEISMNFMKMMILRGISGKLFRLLAQKSLFRTCAAGSRKSLLNQWNSMPF